MLYNRIQINQASGTVPAVQQTSQFYRGFSSVDDTSTNVKLFDKELVKQDLLNYFNTRIGERLMNPTFGTRIWDTIFEPMTPAIKDQLLNDINTVLSSDPRVTPLNVGVLEQEYGFRIELTLLYVLTNEQETLQLTFDANNGITV